MGVVGSMRTGSYLTGDAGRGDRRIIWDGEPERVRVP